MFNGMIQLVLSETSSKTLRQKVKEYLPLPENTLGDEQTCHHVTLAYKPDDSVYEEFIQHDGGLAAFMTYRILSDKNIAAIFGNVVFADKSFPEQHVTVAGNVPPVNSGKLPECYANSMMMGLSLYGRICIIKF